MLLSVTAVSFLFLLAAVGICAAGFGIVKEEKSTFKTTTSFVLGVITVVYIYLFVLFIKAVLL